MSSYTVTSLNQLVALVKKHSRERENRVRAATRRAAAKGRALVKRNVPVAHGELRESVDVDGTFIIVDAPHAAAVNFGSRPHTPPLEPLVAWVKLRGMQGLMSERQQGRLPGTTTRTAASGVASLLRAHEMRGPFGYSPTDAAVQVARMIQRAISKRGTKAHHFIEASLPGLRAILAAELNAALGGSPGGGDGGGGSGGGGKDAPSAKSKSGKYRQNVDTYHGKRIQTDHSGRRFVDQKKGRVYLEH